MPPIKMRWPRMRWPRSIMEKMSIDARWPIISPEATVKRYWDAVIFAVIFYSCNLTPIFVATPPRSRAVKRQLQQLDLIIDILFLLDTFSGFCYAFVDRDTKELVTQTKAVRDAYLSSLRLKLNVVAATPVLTLPNFANKWFGHGLCHAFFPKGTSRKNAMKLARLTRMSRIFLFFSQLEAVKEVLAKTGILTLNEAGFRMVQIIVSLMFLSTSCGSFYFYIACNDESPSKSPKCIYGHPEGVAMDSWVRADVVFNEGHTTWTNIVGRFIYFMVQTLFTIGYGDSVAPMSKDEVKFTVLMMILGACVYALVIANMTSVLANANVLYRRHQDDVASLNQLLDLRRVPDGLRSRIKLCTDYLWSKQGGMLDQDLLREMPLKLRDAVALAKQTELLAKIPFFAPSSRDNKTDFARAAAHFLAHRVDIPNTTVVYAHEKQRELFIVRGGTLMVYSTKSPSALGTFRVGDFFGDFQLVLDVQHPIAVKTGVHYAETYVLSHDHFLAACDQLAVVPSESDPGVIATIAAYEKRLARWRQAALDAAANATEDAVNNVDDGALFFDGETSAAVNAAGKQETEWSFYDLFLMLCNLTIFPDSRFHGFWSPFLFVAACYTVLIVPVRTMLYAGVWHHTMCGPTRDPTLVVDYVVDCIFYVDVYLRASRFVFVRLDGNLEELVTDKTEIFWHYISSVRGKVDILGAFPWVIFAPMFAAASRRGCVWYAIMRYPHLIRAFHLSNHLNDFREFMALNRGIIVKDKVVAIAMRTYETVFLVVYVACFWSVVHEFGDGESFLSAFLRSVYFAIVTFTTVGYGDIVPTTVSETWFTVIAGAVGATFFAGIVANITSFVDAVDVSDDNVAHQRNVLATFLQERGATYETKDAVGDFFDYIEVEKKGIASDQTLVERYVPSNVRDDVMTYVTHRLVLSCKLFRGVESGFLRAVMLALEPRYYARDEVVITQDDAVHGTSFIADGECDILIDDQKVATIGVTGVFAEGAVLSPMPAAPYSVKCASYTEQFFLSRIAFTALLPSFPRVAAKLPDMARRIRVYSNQRQHRRSSAAPPSSSGSPPSSPTQPEGKKVLQQQASLRVRRESTDSIDSAASSSIREQLAVLEGRRRRVNERLPPGIVGPDSVFAKTWNAVILVSTLWNILVVPWKVGFLSGGYQFRGFVAFTFGLDCITDVAFVCDIVLNARHLAYRDVGGRIVTSRKHIFTRYKDSGALRRHAIASFPFSLLALAFTDFRPRRYLGPVQVHALFRLHKFVRIYDMGDLVDNFDQMLQSALKMPKNFLRLIQLVYAVLVSSHILGCVFMAVAEARAGPRACDRYRLRDATADDVCKTWAQDRSAHPKNLLNVAFYDHLGFPANPLGLNVSATSFETFAAWGAKIHSGEIDYNILKSRFLLKRYVNAFYWGAATITTVGYGDVSAVSLSEIAASIICLLVSVVIYTVIVANLEEIVGNLDVTTTLYHLKREQVKQYCLRAHLPENLRQSVFDYYDKLWTLQKGVAEPLRMLPANLRARVILELVGQRVLKTFPIIFGSSPGDGATSSSTSAALLDVALSLDLELYTPSSFLYHAGECALQMFILVVGTAQLMDEVTDDVFTTIRSKNTIGKSEFLLRVVYTSACKAVDYSQVFVLTYDNLLKVMRRHGQLDDFRQRVLLAEKDGRLTLMSAGGELTPKTSASSRQSSFGNLNSPMTPSSNRRRNNFSQGGIVPTAGGGGGTREKSRSCILQKDNSTASSILSVNFATDQRRFSDRLWDAKAAVAKALFQAADKDTTSFDVSSSLSRRPGFTIHPSSLFKRVWHAACLYGVLYYIISVPFEAAFARAYSKRIFYSDLNISIMYSIDMYLNCNVFALKQQGRLIKNRAVFRRQYLQTYFPADLVSVIPASFLAVALSPGAYQQKFEATKYSPWFTILRFLHMSRLRRINMYSTSVISLFQNSLGLHSLNGDMVHLLLLLCLVVVLCHWLGCGFYMLGRYELMHAARTLHHGNDDGGDKGWRGLFQFNRHFKDESFGCSHYRGANIWLCEGGSGAISSISAAEDRASSVRRSLKHTHDRWLTSFYWACYTASTIGYGAVAMKSNAEKLYAVMAMIVGAVVCDAGITAVLTAYIEHKDHQAGSNKRRKECATKMMTADAVSAETRGVAVDFFTYCDDDLANVYEGDVLDELSLPLRQQILKRAAHSHLCDSISYGSFEASVLASFCYRMRPVVAVPTERIMQIGQPDPSLYVFQSGVAHSEDGAGDTEYVPVGMILSNVEFKQVAKRVGVPTKELVVDIFQARNLPVQANILQRSLGASVCSCYVEVVVVSKTVFGHSVKSCRTKVRKFSRSPVFNETFKLKVYQNTEHATISAIHWRRGLAGQVMGSTEVKVKEDSNHRPKWHSLSHDKKKCGDVRLSCQFNSLAKDRIASTAELTVIADSFCHLYLLDYDESERLKKYVKGLRLPLEKRLKTNDLPPPFRLPDDRLADICGGDDEMSLTATQNAPNARGFEAYMSETFTKRSTKGSIIHVDDSQRGSDQRRPSNPGPRFSLDVMSPRRSSVGNKVHPSG